MTLTDLIREARRRARSEDASAQGSVVTAPPQHGRATDTTADAARQHTHALRALGIAGRARAAFEASDSLRAVVMSGIRHRHPEYDDAILHLAFLKLWLGPELFDLIHPDVEVAA